VGASASYGCAIDETGAPNSKRYATSARSRPVSNSLAHWSSCRAARPHTGVAVSGYPNVNAYASAPGSKNVISSVR
jgi:hypothetical protein